MLFKKALDEQRKAAKQFKRPDISVMKITKLDTFFADKFPYTQKRDNELVDIQCQLLQNVGPLSMLASELAQGDNLDYSTLISVSLTYSAWISISLRY